VAVATTLANGSAYVALLVVAQLASLAEFGDFVALLGLITIANVVALGIAAVTARAAAHGESAGRDPSGTAAAWRRPMIGIVAACTAGALLAAPGIAAALRFDGPSGCLAAAATLAPLGVLAFVTGRLQGLSRFGRLSGYILGAAAARAAGGILGIAWGGTATSAVVGGAAGLTGVAVLGWVVDRGPARDQDPVGDPPSHPVRTWAQAAGSLLGVFVLTNADLLVARVVLSPSDADVYAAGSVLAKAAFWLPSFVAVVALPRLSDPAARRDALRRGLAVLAGIGSVVVVAASLLGSLAAGLVGAPDSAVATWAGLFAAIGCGYAAVQFLVYARIGRAASSGLWLLLGAATALAAVALAVRPDLGALALLALAAGLGTGAVLLALELRAGQPADSASAASGAGQAPGVSSGS
jgi:hypothetical protein